MPATAGRGNRAVSRDGDGGIINLHQAARGSGGGIGGRKRVRAAKRREWPSMTITLETRDGGATWNSQTAPAFGQTTRFRSAPGKGLDTASSRVVARFHSLAGRLRPSVPI